MIKCICFCKSWYFCHTQECEREATLIELSHTLISCLTEKQATNHIPPEI